MTLRLEAGWDLDKVGNFGVKVTEATGPLAFQVTMTTGQLCHTALTSVLVNYKAFSNQLKAALDAASVASGNSWTYTVSRTVSDTAHYYTVSAAEGNTALEFSLATVAADGTRMRQALGFTGDSASAASHSSSAQARPYYAVLSAGLAKSRVSDDYEPDEIAQGDWSTGGSHYTVSASSGIVFHDFDVLFEAKAAVFKRSAAASVPWTYQHLWEHCRGDEPILAVDDTESTVHYLRPEGASFRPERAVSDWDGAWSLALRTYVEGRL